MTLEEQATKGRAIYIHAVGYDMHRGQLIIMLLKHPEEVVIVRTLFFRGVRMYDDVWDDEDFDLDHDIDTIIGIDEYFEEENMKYLIRTASREISFVTSFPPEIIEHV